MIDQRLVRVGIEIDGVLHRYEGLRVKASGTKYTDPTQNDCTITVTGLKASTRDFILGACDPFKPNPKAPRVTLEVGRQSLGYFTLFIGDVTEAEITMPPDVDLIMKCKTNNQSNAKIISVSGGQRSNLRQLAEQCAENNGLGLLFQALNKNSSNYQFIGSAAEQIRSLQRVGNVDCFVDDGQLIVKDAGAALKDRVRILGMNSGMVGIPKATDKGVQVQYLVDAESQLGGTLRLDSKFNKTLSGDYTITELKFDIDTHGDNFFYTATGVRQ
jgi:hypothetical protein